MRIVMSIVLAAGVLAACDTPSPEVKANRAMTEAALKTAQSVEVNGKTFRVAHVTERNQALVALTSTPEPYYTKDVVAAATAVTGCKGEFSGGVLNFLGGDINTSDLQEMSTKVKDFKGWPVALKC